MTQGVETRLDGETLVVRIPMRFQRRGGRKRMLQSGEYGTVAELADTEGIRRSYVCRVLRLTLLAPEIVERILDGRPTAGLAQLLKPFPVEWQRQRKQFCQTAVSL
jgi:hypothetical protein